jgi:hypothetical protein
VGEAPKDSTSICTADACLTVKHNFREFRFKFPQTGAFSAILARNCRGGETELDLGGQTPRWNFIFVTQP